MGIVELPVRAEHAGLFAAAHDRFLIVGQDRNDFEGLMQRLGLSGIGLKLRKSHGSYLTFEATRRRAVAEALGGIGPRPER